MRPYVESDAEWLSKRHRCHHCVMSEDFHLSLRLQIAGFQMRLATYHGDEFKEGVSLTVFDELALRLEVSEGTQVISRHERRFIDDVPWSMQTSFYPMELADRGAERLRSARNIDEGTVQYLAATLNIRQVGYRDWITVRAPDATEADFFSLPPDGRVAVCEVFRTAFDANGKPMRVTVTVFPTDRNQFIVDSGDVPSR